MAGYTLMNVVSEWLAENGKPENQRARLYTIALSCLREINMDVNGIIKIVELDINANDTVDLPNDFLRYSKIGIVGTDGRIHTMGVDNDISLFPVTDDCGDQTAPVQVGNSNVILDGFGLFNGTFFGLNGLNGTVGGVFGLGGGNNSIGYYRLNRATNQLWLANMNTLSGSTIVMEYIADVSSADGDFEVHPFIIQTVKDYIAWKYVIGDRNTPANDKEMRRREYFNSLRLSNNRYSSATPSEWASELRKSNQAATKW
jgi:hypothetical protein